MSEAEQSLADRRKRAIYRASHRGTKEMDIVLGRFAATHIEGMDDRELNVFEELLAFPDPDLNRWIMLEPPQLKNADLTQMIARIRLFHGLVS
jgi:antitoxin CptB